MIVFYLSQLIKKGNVSRGYLGVTIQPVTEDLAQSFGLRKAKGALVNDVIKGSPAEKVGIRQGYVITAFNGIELIDSSHQRLVAEAEIGKPTKMLVFREGKSLELNLALASADTAPKARRESVGMKAPVQAETLGLIVEDVKGEGVVVDLVLGSIAAEAGIKPVDVIRIGQPQTCCQ